MGEKYTTACVNILEKHSQSFFFCFLLPAKCAAIAITSPQMHTKQSSCQTLGKRATPKQHGGKGKQFAALHNGRLFSSRCSKSNDTFPSRLCVLLHSVSLIFVFALALFVASHGTLGRLRRAVRERWLIET